VIKRVGNSGTYISLNVLVVSIAGYSLLPAVFAIHSTKAIVLDALLLVVAALGIARAMPSARP